MAGGFDDSTGKCAVRELWNSPILRYLNLRYGLRYRYLGLPGTQLIDVLLWRDLIDEVVAFEGRESVTADDPYGRRAITELRKNMDLYGLNGYAYYGQLEEVIIRRTDLDDTEYKQSNLVTLYNLDFCSELGSKVMTRREGERVRRFEAIRQLLRDQHACHKSTGQNNMFVLLITVRCQMNARRLNEELMRNMFAETFEYFGICSKVEPIPADGTCGKRLTWALKALTHNTLRLYLPGTNMQCLFFPLVKYTGRTKASPMLHWMIVGRFMDEQAATPIQLPSDYLAGTASVKVDDEGKFGWEPEVGEAPMVGSGPSPVDWFKEYESALLDGLVLGPRMEPSGEPLARLTQVNHPG